MNQTLGTKYTILEFIANGGTSKLYKVEDKHSKHKYAAKILKTDYFSQQCFDNEVNALKVIKDTSIIRFVDFGTDTCAETGEDRNYIIFELAQSESLMEIIIEYSGHKEEDEENYLNLKNKDKEPVPFDDRLSRLIFRKMIKSLETCHKHNYSHRDIKPDNFLITQDYNLILADFGFTQKLKGSKGYLMGNKGTECYIAPEVSYKPFRGAFADYYSLGMSLLAIRTGNIFNSSNEENSFNNIRSKNFSKLLSLGYSEDFIDLIKWLTNFKPETRPLSLSQVLEHSWMMGETASEEELTREIEKRIKAIYGKKRKENINKSNPTDNQQ